MSVMPGDVVKARGPAVSFMPPGSMDPYLLRSYLCVLVDSGAGSWRYRRPRWGIQGVPIGPGGGTSCLRTQPLSPSPSTASLDAFPSCPVRHCHRPALCSIEVASNEGELERKSERKQGREEKGGSSPGSEGDHLILGYTSWLRAS